MSIGKRQKRNKILNKIIDQIAKEYSSLSEPTIASWKTKSNIVSYKKGECLVREGQYHHKLYYVVKGSLKAYYNTSDKYIIDWFAFENEFITSSTSYFTDEPSLHVIEVLEDCIILETTKDNVELLCELHHDFEHLFRLVLSKVIVQFRQRVFSIQFKTVKERYISLITQYPQIELKAPLGDIASFLGISQETLSRIRAFKL